MTEPLITVICAAYNVADYIEECVESIRCQTYRNLEIILVDDGSTDATGQICDDFSKKDRRIQTFHKVNGGISSARNYGLDHAHGDYIAFIDSDDSIEPEMYQTLLELLIQNEADFAACSFFDVYGTRKIPNGDTKRVDVWQGEDIFLHRENLRFLAWNKLYTKEIIGTGRFVEGQVYEEVHFNTPVFFNASKTVYYDACFYNYRKARPGNTNSSFKLGRLCIFKEFDSIVEQLEEHSYLKARDSQLLYMLSFYRRLYKEAVELKAGDEVTRQIRENFVRCFRKARGSGVKLDKGSYAFYLAPNLLSVRDIKKGKRSEREKFA